MEARKVRSKTPSGLGLAHHLDYCLTLLRFELEQCLELPQLLGVQIGNSPVGQASRRP
jgi:hypothetical protein